jgi:hypothetical protein
METFSPFSPLPHVKPLSLIKLLQTIARVFQKIKDCFLGGLDRISRIGF